jgi:hypothetical protein
MVEGAEPHCFGVRLENKRFFLQDILQEAEKQVHMVRENLQVAQSR